MITRRWAVVVVGRRAVLSPTADAATKLRETCVLRDTRSQIPAPQQVLAATVASGYLPGTGKTHLAIAISVRAPPGIQAPDIA